MPSGNVKKFTNKQQIETLERRMEVLSALTTRLQLGGFLGYSYGTDRNLYQALGYRTLLSYNDYAVQYSRQDMAKAIINRPVQATWRSGIDVVQTDVKNETPFEKAWNELWKQLKLKSKFIRLDKLSSLGKYGVLLFGLDDTPNIESWSKPVAQGKRKLLYVKPLTEGSALINSWVNNTHDPRFGMPETYSITIKNSENSGSQTVVAHHSRVIHVPGELMESEIDGIPALQVVFNRLQDLEKIVGGSAEMFWRGARPGYKGKVDKDHTLSPAAKEDLETQIDEYEHNLRRFLINTGIDIDALQMQVGDPSKHVDVQLQMISAVTGIPKRVLVGSERGELASSEDRGMWLELIQSRQKEAEDQIVRPFIDRCVEYGVLPIPTSEYTVIWPDLFSPSEKERADIGKTRASALQSYMNNPAASGVVPVEVFYEFMLGLNKEDLDYLMELHKSLMKKRTQLGVENPPPTTQPAVGQGGENVPSGSRKQVSGRGQRKIQA